ncbi:MAG: hypothetical protein EPO52_00645 [Herbiconiux sp.]|uniref:acyl-CoA carboxylase epsilon subunit n=1 Tax=Herbiconiux sp. TaxID=1871186 RepID=UPI001221017D|nr:acyl-CoA carboxylase epsilon subunit [Herbiconiux sp.]TAJ50108.1 MAG: hypothetical protein EPO52_00645 [Herbiconiux sp.]
MNESTDSAASEPAIRVVTRGLSAEEIAAVSVVVDAAVEAELDELHSEVHIEPSAWERSQRSLRTPLQPGAGAWRSFSA